MPSRNEKPSELSAIRIYRGVSIYKVRGSQYWYVRVWDRERKRYVVKGTGETSVIRAREVAKDHALSLLKAEEPVERQFTFHHFAIKCLSKSESLAAKGERNIGYVKAIKWSLQNSDWGLLKWFDSKDVRKITTRDFTQYMDHLTTKRPDLTASTKNTIMASFRNVLKMARDEGAIDVIPNTPRAKQRDNPRPFFRFYPLVSRKDDAYKKVLDTAKQMAREGVIVRGIAVTDELYDLILFLAHSFVRPVVSEVYAIRHSDVTVAKNPKRLIVVVRDGKTGLSCSKYNAWSSCGLRAYSKAVSRCARPGLHISTAIHKPSDRIQNLSAAVQGTDDAGSDRNWIRSQEKSTRSIRCVTRRSACASFSPKVRSISSISQRTRAHPSIRSSASMRAICRFRERWQSTFRVLAAVDMVLVSMLFSRAAKKI